MFDDVWNKRIDDGAVVFGEIKPSLTRFLGTTCCKNNEVGSRQVFVVAAGDNVALWVEGHAMLEISLFTLGFFDLPTKQYQFGRETLEENGVGGGDANST